MRIDQQSRQSLTAVQLSRMVSTMITSFRGVLAWFGILPQVSGRSASYLQAFWRLVPAVSPLDIPKRDEKPLSNMQLSSNQTKLQEVNKTYCPYYSHCAKNSWIAKRLPFRHFWKNLKTSKFPHYVTMTLCEADARWSGDRAACDFRDSVGRSGFGALFL